MWGLAEAILCKLSRRQVVELPREQPERALALFADLPGLRLLVVGGDGTVGWVSYSQQPGTCLVPLMNISPRHARHFSTHARVSSGYAAQVPAHLAPFAHPPHNSCPARRIPGNKHVTQHFTFCNPAGAGVPGRHPGSTGKGGRRCTALDAAARRHPTIGHRCARRHCWPSDSAACCQKEKGSGSQTHHCLLRRNSSRTLQGRQRMPSTLRSHRSSHGSLHPAFVKIYTMT